MRTTLEGSRFPYRYKATESINTKIPKFITRYLMTLSLSISHECFVSESSCIEFVFNISFLLNRPIFITCLFPNHIRFSWIKCWLTDKVSINSKTRTLHANILILLFCHVLFSKCWHWFDGCLHIMSPHSDKKKHQKHWENNPISDRWVKQKVLRIIHFRTFSTGIERKRNQIGADSTYGPRCFLSNNFKHNSFINFLWTTSKL